MDCSSNIGHHKPNLTPPSPAPLPAVPRVLQTAAVSFQQYSGSKRGSYGDTLDPKQRTKYVLAGKACISAGVSLAASDNPQMKGLLFAARGLRATCSCRTPWQPNLVHPTRRGKGAESAEFGKQG